MFFSKILSECKHIVLKTCYFPVSVLNRKLYCTKEYCMFICSTGECNVNRSRNLTSVQVLRLVKCAYLNDLTARSGGGEE